MNILIVAGGAGTRLWPASRQSKPKQLLAFLGDKTLLQSTFQRCVSWVSPNNIYLATTADYVASVKKQLSRVPGHHFSIEPVLRDRAPAIGLAALIMHHDNPNSNFICMWSDHSISERRGYFKKLLSSIDKYLTAHPEMTLTVGVKPAFAHTGLGYIEKGPRLANKYGLPLYKLKSFKEKPDAKLASRFLSNRRYLWNSGYFAWKTETLLNLYQRHLPDIYNILMKIKPALGTKQQQAVINKWYPKMPLIDIERGLLEKLSGNIATIEGDFSWADLGSWKIIKDVQSGPGKNLTKGRHISHKTSGSLIYNYTKDMLVATVGLKNLVIVVTPEAVLVADKNDSEQVREITKALKKDRKLRKFL
jgi:mannose-1-phosphate guanylyltransferase